MAEKYTLQNGKTLHRWETGGREWACLAYDHGPFCRLCQPVDGVLDALLQQTIDGVLEVRQKGDGAFEFRTTAEGARQVEHLLATRPEIQKLWSQLVERYGAPRTAGDAEGNEQ